MIKTDLLDDLSVITGISKLSLEKLAEKANLCLSHALLEAIEARDNCCEIDIGIGNLYIKLDENAIKYKFIPSKSLEETLVFTHTQKISPVASAADKALGERIENAYRSLI